MLALNPDQQRPRERLTATVFDAICQAILKGRLPVGRELPSESALAAEFGVSKTVIREALQKLAALDIIEIRQGRPSVVKRMSARPLELFLAFALHEREGGLLEAIQLRRAIETFIAMRAATEMKMADLHELKRGLARLRDSAGEAAAFVEADLAFHMTLAESIDNRFLVYLMQGLQSTIRETIEELHGRGMSPDLSATVERHARIVRAIEAGDPEAARLAMEAHFDASEAKTQTSGVADGRGRRARSGAA